jgi:hypothetical protein
VNSVTSSCDWGKSASFNVVGGASEPKTELEGFVKVRATWSGPPSTLSLEMFTLV